MLEENQTSFKMNIQDTRRTSKGIERFNRILSLKTFVEFLEILHRNRTPKHVKGIVKGCEKR